MNIDDSRKLERDKYESIYVDKNQHYRKKMMLEDMVDAIMAAI